MAIKWKNNKKATEEIKLEKLETEEKKTKVWLGYLLVSMLILAVSMVTYRMEPEVQKIREKSEKSREQQKENETVDFWYYSDRDKMSLVSNIYYLNYKMEHMYEGVSPEEYLLNNNKEYKKLADTQQKISYEKKAKQLVNILYTAYRMDYMLCGICNTYTYIYDKERAISCGQEELATVLQEGELSGIQESYQSYMVIDFDENGNPSITKKYKIDEAYFANYIKNIRIQAVADYYASLGEWGAIYDVETNEALGVYWEQEDYEENYDGSSEAVAVDWAEDEQIKINFPKIKNTQVVIAFRFMMEDGGGYYSVQYDQAYELCYLITLCFGVLLLAGAVVLQNIPVLGLKGQPIFKMPTELILIAGFVGIMLYSEELPYIFMLEIKEGVQYWMTDSEFITDAVMVNKLPAVINGGLWLAFYGGVYWVIANVLPYILHPVKSIKENSIIVKVLRYVLKQCKRCYVYATTIKADEGLNKNIVKIVAANFVVICIFCCGWFFGIFGVLVYSILLYFLLMKNAGTIKGQYDKLLSMVTGMARGELNVEVSENLGIFEPMKEELTKVRTGFKHAVEEEVKSQNMKTELITNVSHDLKTPLTAIITYIDLLKNKNLEEETRKEYIATLDKKSHRLKVLIEDLFEVSKASSNNITMHLADVDLVNLVKQVRLENEERIMDSDLIFRWNLPEEKCILRLDPQRTYRVIENLLTNALKYSMSDSRVYVEVTDSEESVSFTMKNISATELNFEAEQLTERFVRGDVSRNTEGSGLGLAIARSFTELQNGQFFVEIDGDLFKVMVVFNR